ncbi:MAG TPA: hypothetical protein VF529_04515 [Solirubrobacteraceae bacterium]|jgi:hypothetical protein
MFLSLLQAVALGWVLGHVAAALIAGRARRRGFAVDTEVQGERWGIALAIVVVGILLFDKIV